MGRSTVRAEADPDRAPHLAAGLLGPVEMHRDGRPVAIGGGKSVAIVAALALAPGRVVAADRLGAALWGVRLPDDLPGTVQVYVSRLRKALGLPAGSDLLRWQAPGYVLDIPEHAVDAGRFERLATSAADHAAAGRLRQAFDDSTAALALWRGAALHDLRDEAYFASAIARLEGARTAVVVQRLDAGLRLGRHHELLPEVTDLVAEDPLDERLWTALMLAEYRCGRPAAALAAYQRARRVLADELGLDPGPELRELERAVLGRSDRLLVLDGARVGVPATVTAAAEDPPPPAAGLVLADGARVAITRARWVIGRDPDSDLVITDQEASRRHALIEWTGEEFVLLDLGSTNGTSHDGERLERGTACALADGDELVLARTRLTFRSGGGEAEEGDAGRDRSARY